ncbi:MAG: hypothetical protein JWN63_1100 [Candidatus Acidoferrum typicum]|nr:hypothetical protein [Candidatus Acidoferrum typicum]
MPVGRQFCNEAFTYPAPVANLLEAKFSARQVKAVIEHFQGMVSEFQMGHRETAITKSGKFVEASLKALWAHLGNTLLKPKEFKVGSIIRQLEQVPSALAEDSVRVTIPRACRFVYEIFSNRGAEHATEQVNPNQMDAAVVVANCS